MNKHLLIISLILIPLFCFAQEEEFNTIFHKNKNEKLKISGFGAPIMNFTAIDDDFALMMGGGCGVILGNVFLGGYGIGKTNEIPYKSSINDNANNDEYNLGMGHGGFWFGYIIQPKKAIHFSLSSQIGWGAITKKNIAPEGESENLESHSITVITPIVEVEYNISHFCKIGTGVTWAYVSGNRLSDTNYTSKDFSKPSFFLSFKFGWFD
jgi:hypothetical protein